MAGPQDPRPAAGGRRGSQQGLRAAPHGRPLRGELLPAGSARPGGPSTLLAAHTPAAATPPRFRCRGRPPPPRDPLTPRDPLASRVRMNRGDTRPGPRQPVLPTLPEVRGGRVQSRPLGGALWRPRRLRSPAPASAEQTALPPATHLKIMKSHENRGGESFFHNTFCWKVVVQAVPRGADLMKTVVAPRDSPPGTPLHVTVAI